MKRLEIFTSKIFEKTHLTLLCLFFNVWIPTNETSHICVKQVESKHDEFFQLWRLQTWHFQTYQNIKWWDCIKNHLPFKEVNCYSESQIAKEHFVTSAMFRESVEMAMNCAVVRGLRITNSIDKFQDPKLAQNVIAKIYQNNENRCHFWDNQSFPK